MQYGRCVMTRGTGLRDERTLEHAYDNAIGVFRALSRASRTGRCSDGGGMVMLHTGSPLGAFNPTFVTHAPYDVPGMFRRIDAFYHECGAPMVLYARSADAPAIERHAGEAGFKRAPDERGMLRSSGNLSIPSSLEKLEIVVVRDPETLEAFHETSARAFGAPRGWIGELTMDRLLAIPGLTLYIGLIHHEPVSTGALFVNGTVAGVHIIGTLAEHRRRGIGQAMTWRVIQDGASGGCVMCALTSSRQSHGLYERMGFEHVANYAVWTRSL
jgi:GNAT superfamily N-acetyltransferase